MGASGSVLLKAEPDWEQFVQQEWRSDISREIDMLGGLNRPAIARGTSFTHKLAWLEATLNKHGTELEQFFNPAPLAPGASLKERMRRPKIPIPTLLAMQPKGPQPVAEWRARVHAARRRVIITVTCAVRLMRGKVHGSAVPRLDHFDFAIYSTLGGDWLRVAEEQQRFMALREAVEAATVALQDAIQAANNNRPGTSDGSEPGSPSAASSQLQLEGLDALMVGPQPPASPRPPAAGGPAIRRDALLAAGAGGGGGEVRSRDVSPITGLPPGRQGGARGGGGAARSNLGPSTISRSGSGVLVGPPHAHSMSGLAATPFSPAMPHRASTFSVGVGSGDRLSMLGGDLDWDPSRQGSNSGYVSAADEDAAGGARRGAVDASGQGSGGAMCPVPPGGVAPNLSVGAPPSKKASGIFLRARVRPPAVEVPGGGHSGPASPVAAPPAPTTPSSGATTPAARPSLYGAERQGMGQLGGVAAGDITALTGSGPAHPSVSASLHSPRTMSSSRSTSLSGCAPAGLAAVPPDSPSAAPRMSGAGLVPTGPGGRPTGLPDSPSMRSRPPVWAMGAAAASVSQSGTAGGGAPGGVPHSPSLSGSAASAFQLPRISMSGKQPPLRADTARALMTAFADGGSESPQQAGGLGGVVAEHQRLRSSFSMDGRAGAGDTVSSPFDSGPMGPTGQAIGPSHLGLGGAGGGGAGGAPWSPSARGMRPLAADVGAVGDLRRSASGRGGSLDVLTRGAEGRVSDGGAGGGVSARRLPLRSDSRQSLRRSASGMQRASSDASRFLGDAAPQHPVANQPHPVGLEEALARARGSLSGTGAGPGWGPALGAEGGQLSPAGGAGANAVRRLQGVLSPSPSMQRATTSVIAASPTGGTSPHHHPSAPLSASGAGHDGAVSPASPRQSPAVPGASAVGAGGPRPVPPPGPATHVARSMSLLRHGSSLSSTSTSQYARGGGSEGGEAGASGGARVGGGGGERLAVSVDVAARIAKLKQQLQVKVEEMNRCSKLISMFLNRCNAAWAESQTWVLPPLASQPHLQAFARSEAAMVFRNELVKLLMTGGVAFHLRAADDVLEAGAVRAWGQGPDGEPLWSGTPRGSQSGSGGEAGRAERLAMMGRGGDGAGGGGGGGSGTTTPGGAVGGGGGLGSGGGGGGGGVVTPGLLCRSTAPDLWTHDPWRMLDTYRPGVGLDGPRMDHVSLGCRVVASLVLAVEAAAGRGAVSRLPLVLVVSEEQQDEVVRQLWEYKFFGIPRENVLVVVQPSHPGYAYDSERRTWRAGDAAHCLPLGSGYGLLQLAWQGEAQAVGEDGVLTPQPVSALSWMEARGITWMLSRRVRDLSLLTREGALDINALAYGLYYHTDRHPSTNIIVEAQLSSSLAQSRSLDSVVLCRKVDSFDSQPSHTGSDRPARSSAGSSSFNSSGGSGTGEPPPTPGSSAAGGGGGSTTSQVVELCYADLTTPAMHAVLGTAQAAGRVLAGVGRYMVHVPGVATMLAGRLSVLRPKLGLLDGMLHLRMELADLTSSRNASTLLLQARPELPLLQVQDDLDSLLPLLQAQDGTPAFRQLVQSSRDDELRSALAALWLMPAQPARVHPNAQRIVVFVVANAISAAAVSMAASVARAGRDTVVLVTVVAAAAFRDRAEQLCAKHVAAFERLCTAECVYDVVERGSRGLIDCMVEYVEARGATLVVMGSNALTGHRVEGSGMSAAAFSLGGGAAGSSRSAATATGPNGVTAPGGITAATAASIHVVGSVTLALLRRMPLPLLLVTRQGPANPGVAATAAEKAEREGRRRALRYMGLLDGGAKGMVDFVAGKLCHPAAGDQLHLAYVRATANMTRQQQANVKALIGRYLHQVAGIGLRPTQTLLLDAPMEVSVANAVAEHSADVLAMVAGPLHSLVPPAVVATLRTSRAAVLWYRDAHTGVAPM